MGENTQTFDAQIRERLKRRRVNHPAQNIRPSALQYAAANIAARNPAANSKTKSPANRPALRNSNSMAVRYCRYC
jgi:hypothetical protein